MATIADVTVAGGALPLGRLLESSSGVSVEVERLVLLGDHVHPYFGVSGGSRECVEESLESQPSVASVERLADVEGRDLYRAGWTSEVDGFGAALLDADGSVLEGSGADGTWEFRLRFPDRERLRRFGDRCDESGLELELNGVYDPECRRSKNGYRPSSGGRSRRPTRWGSSRCRGRRRSRNSGSDSA